MLPPKIIAQTQGFIEELKDLGYTNKEDFARDDILRRLDQLKSGNETIDIPRDQNDELNEAVKEMGTSFRSAEQFIDIQGNDVLKKYETYKRK